MKNGGQLESWANVFITFTMRCFMKTVTIHDANRTEIQRKYIEHIISHMDFMEIRDALRDYLNGEKNRYSNRNLEAEIARYAPAVLQDYFAEYVVNVPTVDSEEQKEEVAHA
jgi:hypothetical protein